MQESELNLLVSEEQKRQEFEARKAHFKILADLFRDGTADVSNDPKWVAMLNKPKGFEANPRMTLEKYMECFPEDVAGAMQAAEQYRQELTNDGYNRKSLAKYCLMGCMPECISKLFGEVYPDVEDRRKAMRHFFNTFPVFKVATRKL